jgi:hypothetical protein
LHAVRDSVGCVDSCGDVGEFAKGLAAADPLPARWSFVQHVSIIAGSFPNQQWH